MTSFALRLLECAFGEDDVAGVPFVSDPLLPPPSSFLPPGAYRPLVRVPCYMLAGYVVSDPVALPPSAYFAVAR